MDLVEFRVTGTLVDAASHQPLVHHAVVVETGVRDKLSSLCFYGITAGNRDTDGHGNFKAVFFTQIPATSAEPLLIPNRLEVHIQFAPGIWRYIDVEVDPARVVISDPRVLTISLGDIPVSVSDSKKKSRS